MGWERLVWGMLHSFNKPAHALSTSFLTSRGKFTRPSAPLNSFCCLELKEQKAWGQPYEDVCGGCVRSMPCFLVQDKSTLSQLMLTDGDRLAVEREIKKGYASYYVCSSVCG